MSTHIVPNTCLVCGHGFDDGEKAYYIAACTLVKYGRGGFDGSTVGIGRGAGHGELRVRFFGGVRKDRRALCEMCYGHITP